MHMVYIVIIRCDLKKLFHFLLKYVRTSTHFVGIEKCVTKWSVSTFLTYFFQKLAIFGDIQVQIWQPCWSLVILVLLKVLPECTFGVKNCQFWHFLKIFCQNATKTSGNIAFCYTFAKIIIFCSGTYYQIDITWKSEVFIWAI